ncbi:hypothetical protein PVA38_11755 [Streptococcus pneumoniae D39]|nr:hypothetical protein PVA38_11755 [Streptococcus pneumoniae D39]
MTQFTPVSYTHLRAHETVLDLVCRLLLEKKKKKYQSTTNLTPYINISYYLHLPLPNSTFFCILLLLHCAYYLAVVSFIYSVIHVFIF